MNKLTPYEQSVSGRLANFPLPAEDAGWQEMKKLLEQEDNKVPVVPPPSKPGCGIGSFLILLLLVGAGLFLLKPQNWFDKKENKVDNIASMPKEEIAANPAAADASGKSRNALPLPELTDHTKTGSQDADHKPVENGSKPDPQPESFSATGEQNAAGKSKIKISNGMPAEADGMEKLNPVDAKNREKGSIPADKAQSKKNNSGAADINQGSKQKVNHTTGSVKKKNRSTGGRSDMAITVPVTSEDKNEPVDTATEVEEMAIVTDVADGKPVDITEPVPFTSGDSSMSTTKINNDSASGSKPAETKKQPKKFHTGAGLGVYQGIPLSGSIDFAVNQAGRKNAVTDYIPSVYLRLYREKKWFIQGEFRYGVPQYSKGFVYKENVKTDAFQNTTTSTYKLHRTYYMQVPFSFNYFILPRWSLGTGITYNRFTKAISSETVRKSNTRMVNDSLVSFKVINDKNDSSFARNSFQWLIETQYKWKRFSFGARYVQGLQPYINYTDPETHIQESRKNSSLYMFIRYEFWNSRRN